MGGVRVVGGGGEEGGVFGCMHACVCVRACVGGKGDDVVCTEGLVWRGVNELAACNLPSPAHLPNYHPVPTHPPLPRPPPHTHTHTPSPLTCSCS